MLKLFRIKRTSRCQERRGATAVEFAMVIPIFALFCVACLDFSRLSLARHAVQNAVYRAARGAMLEGTTRQDTIKDVNDYLDLFGFSTTGGSVVVGQIFLDENDQARPLDTTTEFNAEAVEFYVQATVPVSNVTLVFQSVFPNWVEDREITSEIQIRSERFSGFFNASEAFAN